MSTYTFCSIISAVESMHLNWMSVDGHCSVLAQGMLPICIGANLGTATGYHGLSWCSPSYCINIIYIYIYMLMIEYAFLELYVYNCAIILNMLLYNIRWLHMTCIHMSYVYTCIHAYIYIYMYTCLRVKTVVPCWPYQNSWKCMFVHQKMVP